MNNRVWLVALLFALLAACVNPSQSAPRSTPSLNNSSPVSNSLSDLKKYITVPGTPSAAQWQITRLGPDNNDDRSVPGPSTYELNAVITYSPADLAVLKTASTTSSDSIAASVDEAFFLNWFPVSVKAAFAKQPDGHYVFSDTHYSAQAFYKTPYDEGRLLFVSATEVLVVLIAD